jgi:hypothetical protein
VAIAFGEKEEQIGSPLSFRIYDFGSNDQEISELSTEAFTEVLAVVFTEALGLDLALAFTEVSGAVFTEALKLMFCLSICACSSMKHL